MSENTSAVNLESWMSELPAQLKEVPLIYLAIPGMKILHINFVKYY